MVIAAMCAGIDSLVGLGMLAAVQIAMNKVGTIPEAGQ